MATINSSVGAFSDGVMQASNPGARIVQPLSGREMRREAERRQNKRTKKSAPVKRGF